AHAPGELVPEEGRVLALALQRLGGDAQRCGRIEYRDVGRRAGRQTAAVHAEYARRIRGDARKRFHQRQPRRLAPLERQRQQQLEPGRTGLGLGERQMLAVLVDRRVVRAEAVDHAFGEAARERIAVAARTQRRLETAVRIEVTEVHVGEVHVVDADVA